MATPGVHRIFNNSTIQHAVKVLEDSPTFFKVRRASSSVSIYGQRSVSVSYYTDKLSNDPRHSDRMEQPFHMWMKYLVWHTTLEFTSP